MHSQPRYPFLKLIFTVFWSLTSIVQPVRSQTETLVISKTPKPCFWEMEVLPSPPLSQTEPSIPSLWLAQELYGYSTLPTPTQQVESDIDLQLNAEQLSDETEQYPILETWFVEPKITQLQPDLYVNNLVTLVVNRINWNREKYMGQYVFVSRFASVTRRYGYNLRVCNRQGDLLAFYICNFDQIPLSCQVKILSEGLQFREFRNFNPQ